jgi:hypothetical protein
MVAVWPVDPGGAAPLAIPFYQFQMSASGKLSKTLIKIIIIFLKVFI